MIDQTSPEVLSGHQPRSRGLLSAEPMRLLLLGLDEGFNRTEIGYTDTIILVSISALKHKLVIMSIPRDLWIQISDREKNRIGTVYKTAETKRVGEGAGAITTLVNKIFQVSVHYYVLVKMQGFISIVDSLGGVDITLSQPTAGYPAGITHLDGKAALAFARDRAETDDFARTLQAQTVIKAIVTQVFKFRTWSKLSQVVRVLRRTIVSNVPFWESPQLALMILHAYLNGIESYTITRDMVTPRLTSRGEPVMEPNWDKIRALTHFIR